MDPDPPVREPDRAEPQAPHEDLSFEELARSYNFRLTKNDPRTLVRLIIKECERRPSPVRVLDIGCGRGIARRVDLQWAIRACADEYWGVEPDASLTPASGLFDHHVAALFEDADLPEAAFDVAYSSMVMEHVEDPDAFIGAVARCLKPGGTYLFLTPNRRHYFTRTAAILHGLHMDELILRIIKRRNVEEYHYPVQYRFNDERLITATATRLGFAPPEFAYLEAYGPYPYFPWPTRLIFHLLAAKRRLIRNPRNLLSLVCRLTKPAGPGDGDGIVNVPDILEVPGQRGPC